MPDKLCLELKSLKMYVLAYRNLPAFLRKRSEPLLRDVVAAPSRSRRTVMGEFTPRGGLHK
jgi:7-cyano-7-deazaguanine reductase